MPRDVRLELTTRRATAAVFRPTASRADLPLATALDLIAQLTATDDDIRLTLAGVGDALLHPEVLAIITAAADAGLAVCVESDLVDLPPGMIARLAASGLDVLTPHLPAATAATYAAVMGVDALESAVIPAMRAFLEARSPRAVPLLVPVFTKLRRNLGEMEAWYDHWLRSLGCAVIDGPSDFAGQIPDTAANDISPPSRRPCRRIESRVTILSDGNVVACENDFAGVAPLGNLRDAPLRTIWAGPAQSLREAHAARRYALHTLCPGCRDWHRP